MALRTSGAASPVASIRTAHSMSRRIRRKLQPFPAGAVRPQRRSSPDRARDVDVNVSGQQTIFVADHRRSAAGGDFRQLGKRDLPLTAGAERARDQARKIAAKVALVADVHRIAFAANHGRGDVLPPIALSTTCCASSMLMP